MSKTALRMRSRVDGSARMPEGSLRLKMLLILAKHWVRRLKRQVSGGMERRPRLRVRESTDASMLAGEVSYRMVVDVAGEVPWDLRLTEPVREMWEEDITGDDNTEHATQLNTRSKMVRTAESSGSKAKGPRWAMLYRITQPEFFWPTPGLSYRLMVQTRRGW